MKILNISVLTKSGRIWWKSSSSNKGKGFLISNGISLKRQDVIIWRKKWIVISPNITNSFKISTEGFFCSISDLFTKSDGIGTDQAY